MIDGFVPQPHHEFKEYAEWRLKNGKIVTWILDSDDTSIAAGLTPHCTTHAMWGNLKVVYLQSNKAYLYRLDQYLAELNQGDKSN